MKTINIIATILLACCACHMQAQQLNDFPYPTLPDTLKSVEQRARFLSTHYWDNYDFADSLLVKNADITEQGFVNFIDLLPRFSREIAQAGITAFCQKAFANEKAKEKFESLIDHYYDDPQSPMRNDRVYLLFLSQMKENSAFSEAEKERLNFKLKSTDKNLPGDVALDFTFRDNEGKEHRLSDYKGQRVIIYFYDPECENCQRITEWLSQQTIPTDIAFLNVLADDKLTSLYSIRATPTIFLLDKDNRVVLKDCTAEELMAVLYQQ